MPRESAATRKTRAASIIAALKRAYPGARPGLVFANPLELLVATILSAQTTDKGVNVVTAKLFKRYKTTADYAAADPAEFEQEIRPTGFFRNKTKSVLGACRKLVDDFGGQVPHNMAGLLTLPGVARKTANVVLGSAFGVNEGIAVDRHVARVSARLALTASDKPEVIEQDLMKLADQGEWAKVSLMLINHGRAICHARKPDCANCPLSKLCPSAFKV